MRTGPRLVTNTVTGLLADHLAVDGVGIEVHAVGAVHRADLAENGHHRIDIGRAKAEQVGVAGGSMR